jgi:hypothetical protein
MAPPNLPNGEEKSPFGGFRGSILKKYNCLIEKKHHELY